MAERPYTVASCAISLDGYLDGPAGPLLLSSAADLDRVDGERAACDAILVGAATVRSDDPRLLVRSEDRRRARVARGLATGPTKVTVTGSGLLDPASAFFAAGDVPKLVYCSTRALDAVAGRLGAVATVLDGGEPLGLRRVAEDLHARGVRRLLVEGGGTVHTQLLAADLVDELQLVVAPCFVGDPRAHRFVGDGPFPFGPDRRAPLVETRPLGDVVLLRYALSSRFRPDAHEET